MKELNYQREIVERCIAGDLRAQYDLYRIYSKGMFSICKRMMSNTMEAEDMLQESFMDVYKKLHTFKFESTPGAWIKRIVVNNCINKLRKNKMYFEDIEEGRLVVDEDKEDNDYQYEVAKIKQAMEQLPNGYRVIFSLYAIEGYDHQEISEILNISNSTSKSQYSRAKKKLKEIMSNI